MDDFVEPADDSQKTKTKGAQAAVDPKRRPIKESKTIQPKPISEASVDVPIAAPVVQQVSTKEWDSFNLHPLILQGLQAQGFASPTPIQAQALPMALGSNRDIIGAAETVG